MDELFQEFGDAYTQGNGIRLAATLSPDTAKDSPDRLRRIWEAANANEPRASMGRRIQKRVTRGNLAKDEAQGWADVYAAYFKTIREILMVEEEGGGGKGEVSKRPGRQITSHSGHTPCTLSLALKANGRF